MKLRVAIATAITALLVGTVPAAKAESPTPDEIARWNAGVATHNLWVWNIEMWNQARVRDVLVAHGETRVECSDMLLALARRSASDADLHQWLYIGRRESQCHLWALADRPSTGDYSVCWFQINYYRGLRAYRTALYGPPELLLTNGDACANAALSLKAAAGWSPW